MADPDVHIRQLAEESLARGDRIEAGQLFVRWAYKRERTNPKEALDGYRQAAVHLDGCADDKSIDLARAAWRAIAGSYAKTTGAQLPASLAWQKYAELAMKSTDPDVLVEAGYALAGAGTWLGSLGEAEKTVGLASKALKCLAAFLRHYIPTDTAYKETAPRCMKELYEQAVASGKCDPGDLEACRETCAQSWGVVGMAALMKEKTDLAKRQAEVAMWFTLQKEPVEEAFAMMSCRIVCMANLTLEEAGASTTKTLTPTVDKYIASKPPSFEAGLLDVIFDGYDESVPGPGGLL